MKLLGKNSMLLLKPTILAVALLGVLGSPVTWGREPDVAARVNTIERDQRLALREEAQMAAVQKAADTPCNSESLADMITVWRDAWARQDLEAYFAYYLADFKGSYKTHAQWRKNRSRVITSAGKIELSLSDIKIDILDNCVASVTFKQDYRSDLLIGRGVKELSLQFMDGQWRIQRETFSRDSTRKTLHAASHELTRQASQPKDANAVPATSGMVPERRDEKGASSAPADAKDAMSGQAVPGAAAKAVEPEKTAEIADATSATSQIIVVIPESQMNNGSSRVTSRVTITWVGDGINLVRKLALAAGVAFGGAEGNVRPVNVNVKFADMPLQQALETIRDALGADIDLIVRPTEYLVRFK